MELSPSTLSLATGVVGAVLGFIGKALFDYYLTIRKIRIQSAAEVSKSKVLSRFEDHVYKTKHL